MTDSAAAPLSGLFDRSTKGKSFGPIKVAVERGRIRFFSKVLGNGDPVHSDVEVARSKGYPDIVAPPSFFMVIEAEANDELERQGERSILDQIGCDFTRLLHGDERYDYVAPIFAGDELTLTTDVVDFYDKKGGLLEFVMLQSVVEHPERGVLLRATRNLLHRLG